MIHTSQLDSYASYGGGRKALYWKRPGKTTQKKYREPKPDGYQNFRNKRIAMEAIAAFNAMQTLH